jgi:tetratricopeptide (TPR) repeat protein
MSIDVHDWLKAEPGFIRALAIDANNPQLHLWYGSLLGKFGRAKEAIAQVNAGLGVDPTSLALNTQLAAEYYRARMPAEYYRQALDVVKLFPFEATAHLVLARAYEWAGDWEKGLESCREADKYRVSQAALCLRGSIEAGRGNLGPARAIAENIESYWNTHPFETVLVAALYSRIGDRPKVFALLEAGVARNDGTVLMVPTHPHFDPVRNDSQYRSFLRRIGL